MKSLRFKFDNLLNLKDEYCHKSRICKICFYTNQVLINFFQIWTEERTFGIFCVTGEPFDSL